MTKKREKLAISVDRDLYPLEAIYGASYSFLDKAYIRLEKSGGKEVKITLKGKKTMEEGDLIRLEDEFMNELLNFSLKNQISKKNKKIREYIIGRALTSALPEATINQEKKIKRSLSTDCNKESWSEERLEKEFTAKTVSLNPDNNLRSCSEGEKDDIGKAFVKDPIWEKDPKGIAIPWEKKYKEKQKTRKKK